MLDEIFAVSRYTSLPGKERFTFLHKLLSILKIYCILLLFLIFICGPLHKFADYFVQHVMHHKNLDLQFKVDMDKFRKKLGSIASAFYICLVGPIIEEVTFRLSLSFKKNHIAFSLAFAVLLFSGLLPVVKILDNNLGLLVTFLIRIGVAAATLSILLIFIPNDIRLSEKVKLSIIIFSMGLFSLVHISNYSPIQWSIIWIYPIYVLPQFLIGWGITFTRFKYGFIWGIVLHCLVNSVSVGLASLYNQKTAINHQTINHPKILTDTTKRIITDTPTNKK